MEARVLLTAAELDLFSDLEQAPSTAAELAARRGYALGPLIHLLDAITALGLLQKSTGVYRPAPQACPLLCRDSETSVLPMLLHQSNLWRSWSTLTDRIDPDGAQQRQPAWTESFIGAMHVIARGQAPELVKKVGLGEARRLLDVGGASGTYTEAFVNESSELRATLFDRPEVIELARQRLHDAPCAARVEFAAGDFLTDPLPTGHDLAWLSAIIHSCSPEEICCLFTNVAQALLPGGRIVVRDYVMNSDRTAPAGGALFAVNMLVNTKGGSTYTLDEIGGWLEGAGFSRVRQIAATETMDSLVEAFLA